jgi:DNA-binding Lrp family transcriptional regulator
MATLSRSLGPSRDVIERIIRKDEESGAIRGYITVLDIGKLGYIGVAVYARVETTDESHLRNLLRFVATNRHFYWSATLGGRFDVLMAIQATSLVHFAEVLSDLQRRFPFLVDMQFAIRTRATQFQRQYLNKRSTKRIHGGFTSGEERYRLNERERRILEILIADPRASVIEIARLSTLSRITVSAIIKRLEEAQVIQGYSALLRCQELGYEGYLVLISLRRFDERVRADIRRFVAKEPGVIFCIEAIGAWQTELHCEVPSQGELQQLTRRFRAEFSDNVVSLEVIAALEYYEHYRYRL